MHKKDGIKDKWNSFAARLKSDKKFSLWVYGGAIVLALALYFIGGSLTKKPEQNTKQTDAPEQSITRSNDDLENRLMSVLSQIRGAGKVEVLITYETSQERVTATMNQTDTSISESDKSGTISRSEQRKEITEVATITVSGGQEPIVLLEKEPVVRGVIVVAEGASDPFVKLDLQRAVQAVTGAQLSNIEVFEMTWSS